MNVAEFHLNEVPGGVRSIETESRTVGARSGGAEDGVLVFNGDRVSVWEDKNSLQMECRDGCTIA